MYNNFGCSIDGSCCLNGWNKGDEAALRPISVTFGIPCLPQILEGAVGETSTDVTGSKGFKSHLTVLKPPEQLRGEE